MSENTEPTEHDGAPLTSSGKQPTVAEELERVLRETEASITELREELDRINVERLQHAEVDRLEEHMATSTVRWKVIKEFLRVMLGELRGGRKEQQEKSAEATSQGGPRND